VGFAQLRLAHFDQVLRHAGHLVRTVVLGPEGAATPPAAGWAGRHHLDADDPALLARLGAITEGAKRLVSAGPYRPGLLATQVAGDRPVWIDLPGDPFAELHAQSLHGPLLPGRRASALAHALPALDRGDAFSVIGTRQRIAALGELGARGRLLGPELPAAVHPVPIAWAFPGTPAAPRQRAASDPLRIVLMGALNAWFDEETLIAGLSEALPRDPRLEVDLCGGAHPAHPPAAWERLDTWARSQRGRVRVHGWVPGARLDALLSRGHVGISLDRPGVEPLLGSRTRVLGFLWAGLDVIASRGTELVDSLARGRAVHAVAPGDAHGLAERLLALADEDAQPQRIDAAQALCARRYAPLRLGAPLAAWASSGTRLPALPSPEQELSQALDAARAELAAVHRSPTWRLLSRAHRAWHQLSGHTGTTDHRDD